MELVRWEPFAGFGDVRSVFNDLFDENFDRSSARPSTSKWYPAVDVLESKGFSAGKENPRSQPRALSIAT